MLAVTWKKTVHDMYRISARMLPTAQISTPHGTLVPNRVFIKGVPDRMSEIELEVAFANLGFHVIGVRIIEDMRTGRRKGYGFVTFLSTEEALMARQMVRNRI
ncbi:protein boule-like [Nematostella vectensis]|uniref:protein boule-like n=1 Tax=Nematostella vectensis TaxID=45351 RepID=UPI00138FBBC8|nr:protein boule-like [Nematostella vectensis]